LNIVEHSRIAIGNQHGRFNHPLFTANIFSEGNQQISAVFSNRFDGMRCKIF